MFCFVFMILLFKKDKMIVTCNLPTEFSKYLVGSICSEYVLKLTGTEKILSFLPKQSKTASITLNSHSHFLTLEGFIQYKSSLPSTLNFLFNGPENDSLKGHY